MSIIICGHLLFFIADHVTIKNSTHNEIFKLILKIFSGKYGSHLSQVRIDQGWFHFLLA